MPDRRPAAPATFRHLRGKRWQCLERIMQASSPRGTIPEIHHVAAHHRPPQPLPATPLDQGRSRCAGPEPEPDRRFSTGTE
ncbi:hypothetical protein THIX_90380 [Thiomonas sp. X19]|nr:hypothetical protein THIX_90380 [Thiomonas sp. X19]